MQPSTSSILARLMRAFPREPLTQDTHAAYHEDLSEIPPTVLDAAVTAIIRTRRDPWFPTIGAIREACAEHVLELPSDAEALAQIDARIGWGRTRTGDKPDVHPLVAEALGLVGGYPAIRTADEPHIARGQFARVYRELRADRIRVAVMLPQLGVKMIGGG